MKSEPVSHLQSDGTRTLLLLRHAKSSWEDRDLDDSDRPLNSRGRRDAPRVGAWIQRSGREPTNVLCSPAARTRETWAAVAEQLADPPEATFEDDLYLASTATIRDLVGSLPSSCSTALVIGHNPGIGETMNALAGDGTARQLRRLATKVPTAALAVLRWDGAWSDAAPGCAVLEEFVIPADLKRDGR